MAAGVAVVAATALRVAAVVDLGGVAAQVAAVAVVAVGFPADGSDQASVCMTRLTMSVSGVSMSSDTTRSSGCGISSVSSWLCKRDAGM